MTNPKSPPQPAVSVEDVLRRFVMMEKSIMADIRTAHNRGAGSTEGMRDDDREMRDDLHSMFNNARTALDRLPLVSAATPADGVPEACRDDGSFADTLRDALKPFADIGNRKAALYIQPDDPIIRHAQRLLARSTASLLEPVNSIPAGCYCTDICMAPRMMGRQQPCRREGGIPGKAAPKAPTAPIREAGVVRSALDQCMQQFAFYATEHAKAGKHEKAATNQRFADLCAAALGAQGEG